MSSTPFRVRVEQGPSEGQQHTIKTDALVIGADPGVDIVIQARGVDDQHARIVFDGGQVRLEDLGSSQGTFRNGQRLLGPVQLFPGDRVGLGPEVILILEGEDPAAETDPDAELGDLGLSPDEPISS